MSRPPRNIRTARSLTAFKSLVHAVEGMAGLQINQLHTFGLTQGQFRALEALLHSGPLSQAAVSERMFCGQSNVSYITERLRRRGLIVQLVNEDDRRGKLMHLTPEGRRLISKVFLLHATLIRAQMSVLDARELETLFRMCVKLGNGDAVKLLREMMSGNESENWMKAMGEARLEERVRGAG
jgi:MarR family transcriptional regulator, 2-MHQ and catechol-resistance regulon repressor